MWRGLLAFARALFAFTAAAPPREERVEVTCGACRPDDLWYYSIKYDDG